MLMHVLCIFHEPLINSVQNEKNVGGITFTIPLEIIFELRLTHELNFAHVICITVTKAKKPMQFS